MNKRWRPNNSYYYIDIAGEVHRHTWDADNIDFMCYAFGNCFETREQAEAAAAKVKELLLSMPGEAAASSVQFPKLTEEVFNHPDCPEWARWAAVDADGTVALFDRRPVIASIGKWWDRVQKYHTLDMLCDPSDWQNSIIERPEKSLPKLTDEVFSHPDCPDWAQYAAVDSRGYAYWFKDRPLPGIDASTTSIILDVWTLHGRKQLIPGLWDSSDWRDSLLRRPEKSYPKLTEEVFARPDCPEWAQYAAVDADGMVALFEHRPKISLVGNWWDRVEKYCPLDGRYDSSNWRNSLIERPAKLPDWCKVDAMGWHKRCGYFKVTYIDDVAKRVDIQQVGDKSKGYFSFHTICKEAVKAHPRPYNAEEMQKLVGKVLELAGNRDLVISYDDDSEAVYANSMWMDADELFDNGYTVDGEPCSVLEHLEGTAWVATGMCEDK